MRLFLQILATLIVCCFLTDVEALAQRGITTGIKPPIQPIKPINRPKSHGCSGPASPAESLTPKYKSPETCQPLLMARHAFNQSAFEFNRNEDPSTSRDDSSLDELPFRLTTGASTAKQRSAKNKADLPRFPFATDLWRRALTPTYDPKALEQKTSDRLFTTDEAPSYAAEKSTITKRAKLVEILSQRFEHIPNFTDTSDWASLGQLKYRLVNGKPTKDLPSSEPSCDLIPFSDLAKQLLMVPKDEFWLGVIVNSNSAEIFLTDGHFYYTVDITSDGNARWNRVAYTPDSLEGYIDAARHDFSNQNIYLFDARITSHDEVVLTVPDLNYSNCELTISLRHEDRALIQKGESLPDEHKLNIYMKQLQQTDKPLMLFSHPFQIAYDSKEIDQIHQLVFNLQKAYPNNKIYRDPMSDRTEKRVTVLMNLRTFGSDDVKVIIADPSDPQRADSMKTIENIREDLDSGPLKPRQFGPMDKWTESDGKVVIVISGHSAPELAEFVDRLGKAGVFRDNYIVFNSCGTSLTGQLIERINGVYGASGVFTYNGNISLSHAGELVMDLAEWLMNGGGEFESALRKLLRVPGRKLNGVWIFSRAMPSIPCPSLCFLIYPMTRESICNG